MLNMLLSISPTYRGKCGDRCDLEGVFAAELDTCCTSKVLGTFAVLVANRKLVQDALILQAWSRYLARGVLRLDYR